MAFTFAAASGAPAAPAFGATSSPGFSFGGSSTPAFGASSTPAFGGSSNPAFGAATSANPFGAPAPASTPAFGFAAASAPAFGAASAPFAQQSGVAPFGQPQQAAPQAFTYSTKFDELPQDIQRQLTQIQDEISKYSRENGEVDAAPHMQDASSLRKDLHAETSSLREALRAMHGTIYSDNESMADFRQKVMCLLKATEGVVRTYQRSKLWRDAPQQYRGQMLPPALQELLASPVCLPSPFLEQAVTGFQQNIEEYKKTLSELEQALSAHSGHDAPDMSVLEALPTIISNMHEYFVHVAAKLERIDSQVQRGKAGCLARLRQQGDISDPFERVRRQEDQDQQHRLQARALPALTWGQQQQQQQLGAGGAPAAGSGGGAAAAGPSFAQPAGALLLGPGVSGAQYGAATAPATPFGTAADAGANLSRSASKTQSGGRSKKRY